MGDERGETAETSTTVQTMGEDGILYVRLKPGSQVTLDDAQASLRVTDELAGNRRIAVLVDARPARSITRDARIAFSDSESRRNTIAQAIVVASGVSRAMGSFFIGLNRPAFPVRLFTAEAEAVAWLKGFLAGAPDR